MKACLPGNIDIYKLTITLFLASVLAFMYTEQQYHDKNNELVIIGFTNKYIILMIRQRYTFTLGFHVISFSRPNDFL